MSGSSVNKHITTARLPGSPGGARIWKRELDKAWKEANRPEAGDPTGKPISAAEAKAFEGLVGTNMSRGARRQLKNILGKIPELLQPTDTGEGGATPISGPGAKRPVFISDTGWPVPRSDISGTPSTGDIEEGFYRLALLASVANQTNGKVPGLSDLSNTAKSKLVEKAISMAKKSLNAPNGQLAGLDISETSQLRSSAFTLLWQLGKATSATGGAAQLNNRIHSALVKMADGESHKWLGKHMARMLDKKDYTSTLTSAQRAECREVFEAHHPQKFDVGNILDADGYISWEHVCGKGEGFFKSFQANLAKKSIGGAKFKKVSSSWGKATYELTFPNARGENGRVKGARIEVREFNNDMFDSVGQKKGFSYGGHSSIGNNQEKSLERAMLKGLKANSPQLCMLDLCAGLDNLDSDLENLGDIEVLTTFGSSFFWKGKVTDENGNKFDGVTRSEGMESLVALLDGLSREDDYEGLRTKVSKSIQHYSHERNPNVVFPTLEDYREVRWAHLDGDNDGRMDANDVLYQFGLAEAASDPSHEFELKSSGNFDELDGDALKDSVLDVNVATHYNSETSSNWGGVEHKFLANGYFDGAESTELMKFTPGSNHDGKPTFNVTYNSRLAHTSREGMEALTAYSSMLWLSDSGKVDGLSEVDSKLMALTFAAFALNYDGQGRTNDQRIWKQMLQVLRLPSNLPYGPLAGALDAEHHDYAGNMKIVKKYKAQLTQATREALEAKQVGRPDGGPPMIS